MSLIKRTSMIDKAILTATGNSLVICGSSTEVSVNTSDMMTLSGSATRDYRQAGSMAKLDLLSNSTILYAELIWYSTVASKFANAVDVRSIQDQPITLIVPSGESLSIPPDNGQDFTTFTLGEIVRFRSANVTSLIAKYLGGNYSVTKVPTSMPPVGLSDTRAGWSLNVIYRNDTFSPKKIDFLSGIGYSTKTQPFQITLSGFTTPSNRRDLKGDMLLTVANALPLSGTETVGVGPSLASLTTKGNPVGAPNKNPLTAPNNPYNNFFGGMINECNLLNATKGLIDITGTLGSYNHDAFGPVQNIGARNKWDMTTIDITNTLVPEQTQLAFQLTSPEFSAQILTIGTQIEVVAPDITVLLEGYDYQGNEQNVCIGEKIVCSITVKNNGAQTANKFNLRLSPKQYTAIVPDTLRINNQLVNGLDIAKGINIGSVEPYSVTKVTFEIIILSLPPRDSQTGNYILTNAVDYQYEFVSGIDTITNYGQSNAVSIHVKTGGLELVQSVSNMKPLVGETVSYNYVLTNTGTERLQNISFQCVDAGQMSFMPNSVSINDVIVEGINPNEGFKLKDLIAEEVMTVKYSVTIDSVPPSKTLALHAVARCSYQLGETGKMVYLTAESNDVLLSVQYSHIIKTIAKDNEYAQVGDPIKYIINLTNVGNLVADTILVQEPVIEGYRFKEGSVMVNGQNLSTANPYTGFNLPESLPALGTTIVTYEVLVVSIPVKQAVDNTATVPYHYNLKDKQGVISDTAISNTVQTLSNYVCMTMVEEVDKDCANLEDEVYYTLTINNSGNISANGILFTSALQSDVAFVPGSVLINGRSFPNYDPITGFNIGSIYAENSVQVQFVVKVINIPQSHLLYNKSNLNYSYLPNPTGTIINESLSSNRVQTTLDEAYYRITKEVDKTYAVIGDALVYTIKLDNVGSVDIEILNFYDELSKSVEFIPGTVFVNGINETSYDPKEGFKLNTIHAGESTKIIFGVRVVSVPLAGFIVNRAAFTLVYQHCADMPLEVKTDYSNEVRTYVVDGNLSMNKTTSHTYAKLGDIISYEVNLTNNGNVPLTEVQFVDALSSDLEFVEGSVLINDISKASFNPIRGFNIGGLNVGQVVKVSFGGKVNHISNPNTITNFATATYSFIIDPTKQPQTQSKTSNTVSTVVNKSEAVLTKKVDKAYATLEEIVTYTLLIENTGTVPLTQVMLIDPLQGEAAFVEASVTVNGVPKVEANPNQGFRIEDVLGNAMIIYKAKVVAMPENHKLVNQAKMTYETTLIPLEAPVPESRTSNEVVTTLNLLSVSHKKEVNKAYATSDEVLTYTSIIQNNSTIPLKETNYKDSIPTGILFEAGSVKINEEVYEALNPNVGFTVGDILPGQVVKISFEARVALRPNVEIINNQSNISYSYQLYPDKAEVAYGNTLSNGAKTTLKMGEVLITKRADREYARLGDLVSYQIELVNTGNVILQNLAFIDSLQEESTFQKASLSINNVVHEALDPNSGFSLPDLSVGGTLIILFKVKVEAIPAIEGKLNNVAKLTYSYPVDPLQPAVTTTKASNITTVNIVDTVISATKTVNKDVAKLNETLTFTVTIANHGTVIAEQFKFVDSLESHLEFVAQSVLINEVAYKQYNPNKGFKLPDLKGGETVRVSFKAKIITRPALNSIYNTATMTYEYTIEGITYEASIQSNTIRVIVAYGELKLLKAVDKTYARINDSMMYTIVIKNTGSVKATQLFFKDIIDSNSLFNIGTVRINEVSYAAYSPNVGFDLPDLDTDQAHMITFSTKVISLPAGGKIVNAAQTNFTYQLSDLEEPITSIAVSDEVITRVMKGTLNVTKSVDKAYATLKDLITYTIQVSNTGNVVCQQVFFKDSLQAEISFVAQSVTINGAQQGAYDPNLGFHLPDIQPGQTQTVVFKVQVTGLPSNKVIGNISIVNYVYESAQDGNAVNETATSNQVETVINEGKLNVVKSVDKAYATLEDLVTYTIDITNTGTVDALAVNFRDVLKPGLSFVQGSIVIGGISFETYNPYDSFSLGTLTPGQSIQVKFKASVSELPTPNTVRNVANVVFSYFIDPFGEQKTVEQISNEVLTTINRATIEFNKKVDKLYALAGEILTYECTLTNKGNVEVTSVRLVDNLPEDISFKAGSVKVNGILEPNFDPTVGFDLGRLPTLESVNVSFEVVVSQKPLGSSIINRGEITYSYQINPEGESYTATTPSNTIYTTLVLPNIVGTKQVDVFYATLEDHLDYSVIVKNTGNHLLTSIAFRDELANGGQFRVGTVYIDGVNYPNYNPVEGFQLPDLTPGKTTKVQFETTVVQVPSPPTIINRAQSTAECVIETIARTLQLDMVTNKVKVQINVGALSVEKEVDKTYAELEEVLTHTNVIKNIGNVIVTGIVFKELLKAEVAFVPNSVKLNGVAYPDLNPVTGFALKDLEPNATLTVSFETVINALPIPPIVNSQAEVSFKYKINPLGNEMSGSSMSQVVPTNIVKGELIAVKSVDKTEATLGDDLTYRIILTNIGNVTLDNIKLTDLFGLGSRFKIGSTVINNVPQAEADPTVGFLVPSIIAGGVAIVEFKATVVEVPTTNSIINVGEVAFSYLVNPAQSPHTQGISSNSVTTNIVLSKLEVVKVVDKQYATFGEKLTYTIMIRNMGNIKATNVKFVDPIPDHANFVEGSVTVNGKKFTGYHPERGFTLGLIDSGETVTITYQVQLMNRCSS